MPRARANSYKPKRKRKTKFRDFLPRVGFTLRDCKARALLDVLDLALIKKKIKDFSDGLNKTVVDQALAYVFDEAIKIMEQDPSAIAETTPADFWEPIKNAVHWTRDFEAIIIFQLIVALLVSHEKYDEIRPYKKFQNQYGRAGESCHKFSGLLKRHHYDNPLLMSIYYKTSIGLDSDLEADDEQSDVDENQMPSRDSDGDTVMGNTMKGEGKPVKGKKRAREGNDQEAFGSKRREMGLGDWVYTEEEAQLAGEVGAMSV
ncbi:hypothetical protein F4779DRAFT_636610 [Xylariaceae sp. FL0662B]|nr:hypothetical protein F4779DRAFT_636610 [Xylariaceae sp. FL0662B]